MIRKTFFALAGLAIGAAGSLRAQSRAQVLGQIDSVVRVELERAKVPGGALAVVDHGQLVVAKGYGFANLEDNMPASAETIFRIGSITKQFTAVGIMQQVEQGKIALSDPITKFLPNYATQGHRVTIEHLLTHTSGIKSYTNLGPKFWQETTRLDLTNDQLVAMFEKEPFEFNPGEKYAYNNSAFFLLGMIIEKVTGIPYPTYLKQKILEPLGLGSTSFCDDRAILPHRSAGYEVRGTDVVNAVPISMGIPGAAGSICSTVLDLATWQRAFNDAKLISPASRDRIRTSETLTNGQKTNYGFGVGVTELEGRRLYQHSGGINGFVSWLGYFPDADLTVVVLTNSGSGPAPRIGTLVGRVLLGMPLPKIANLAVDPATKSQAVGTYDLGEVKLVVREAQGGGLEGIWGTQAPTALLFQGESEFRPASQPDFRMRFRSSQGESSVLIEGPGVTFKGKKQ